MKKATKPFEIIYITSFISKSADGDNYSFMAIDEFSDFLYPAVMVPEFKNDNELVGTLVKFFNGINDSYNREIHAQSTTYIVDLPEVFHPFVKSMIMKEDNLVYSPEKVVKIFKPIFKEMGIFK